MAEKQEACQLFIEQEIEDGLARGETPYHIGKRLVPWLQKLFEAAIPAKTIEKKAQRQAEKLKTNVFIEQTPIEPNQPKFLVNTEAEILHKASEIRKEKKEKQVQYQDERKREIIEQPIPENKYQTIVIDPPWPVEKIIRDERPNQDVFAYPTMSIEEITNFKTSEFAADNCHIYMWSTHKFLPLAFLILDSWGFKYQCLMVWHKPGGFQPFGMPQFNCEFVLLGKKGSLKFLDTKAFPCCFTALRGKHSEKPDTFYDVVSRVSPGPKIDIFARKEREGWDVYGDEV